MPPRIWELFSSTRTINLPQIKEIWIMQQRPAGYNAGQSQGSKLNPYIIAAGANEVPFDTLMNTLAKTYVNYRPISRPGESEPPPMTNQEVLFLHIGPGT